MRKTRTLLLFVFLSLHTLAQKPYNLSDYLQTINYTDHNITFHTLPAADVKFTDQRKTYYWYSSNQIKMTQGGFAGKVLNGLYTDYYLNKNLKEQGNFKLGLKEGVWKTWTRDGILTASHFFKKGIWHGPFSKYDSEGKITTAGNYKDGKLNGSYFIYNSEGGITRQHYKDGKLIPTKQGWIKKLFTRKSKNNFNPI